jgi:hypothetical protein
VVVAGVVAVVVVVVAAAAAGVAAIEMMLGGIQVHSVECYDVQCATRQRQYLSRWGDPVKGVLRSRVERDYGGYDRGHGLFPGSR